MDLLPIAGPLLGVVCGSILSYCTSQKLYSRQIEERNKEFLLKKKIDAYEYALKILPEFPRNPEMLRATWAAATLLKMYLPEEQRHCADFFDLKGPDCPSFKEGGGFTVLPSKLMDWSEHYDRLLDVIRQEIDSWFIRKDKETSSPQK